MSTATPATASALIAGLLLGTVSARPKLRRIRAELADTRRLAEQDALTGLPNRAGAQRHLRLAAATGRAQAAVLLDLDKFKTVNDTWGHQTGDALLVAVAARLAHACTPIAASVARLSGDEFLLLLPHADPHTLLTQVRTVLDGLHEPMTLSVDGAATTTVTPTASAGIALPESPSSTVCAWTPSRHSATRPMLPGSRPVPASRAVAIASATRPYLPLVLIDSSCGTARLRCDAHTMRTTHGRPAGCQDAATAVWTGRTGRPVPGPIS